MGGPLTLLKLPFESSKYCILQRKMIRAESKTEENQKYITFMKIWEYKEEIRKILTFETGNRIPFVKLEVVEKKYENIFTEELKKSGDIEELPLEVKALKAELQGIEDKKIAKQEFIARRRKELIKCQRNYKESRSDQVKRQPDATRMKKIAKMLVQLGLPNIYTETIKKLIEDFQIEIKAEFNYAKILSATRKLSKQHITKMKELRKELKQLGLQEQALGHISIRKR